MARGWESKAVEDQMAAAESDKVNRAKRVLSAGERERQARLDSLMLARAKTLKDLESAADGPYRTMLQRALAHLDSAISEVR